MTIFKFTANPCFPQPGGSPQIVITDVIARDTQECTVAELPAKLQAFAAKHAKARPEAIYVSAYPAARAPRGWKDVEAADGNRFVLVKVGQVQA